VSNNPIRHFLTLKDSEPSQLRLILAKASQWKGVSSELAEGKTLIMFFAKPSTRTRLSFEIAFKQMGGIVSTIEHNHSQISRGETIADTIRVFNGYGDVVMWRTNQHSDLVTAIESATIPIINGLTDLEHPCQVLADIMTLAEHKGGYEGKNVVWFGDYSNVARSWVAAANLLDFNLTLITPCDLSNEAIGKVQVYQEAKTETLQNADCITTDTWFSMDNENNDKASIRAKMLPYQVNENIMKQAPQSIFLHCLPATRGEEVTEGVLESSQAKVWDESNNRLHVQKAILAWCLNKI